MPGFRQSGGPVAHESSGTYPRAFTPGFERTMVRHLLEPEVPDSLYGPSNGQRLERARSGKHPSQAVPGSQVPRHW